MVTLENSSAKGHVMHTAEKPSLITLAIAYTAFTAICSFGVWCLAALIYVLVY